MYILVMQTTKLLLKVFEEHQKEKYVCAYKYMNNNERNIGQAFVKYIPKYV